MRKYILYRLVPSANRPGKTDKIPLSPVTLRTHSPLDPEHWVTWDEAKAAADRLGAGFGVGWVVQPGEWFVDIDNARDPSRVSGWSAASERILALLAGCYVEVSQSGNGLHAAGRGVVPPHAIEVAGLGGLYTEKRFCALTGIHASGDMNRDFTLQISQVVAEFFPARAGVTAAEPPFAWTTGPVEGWSGPEDDDDLIRQALASRLSGPQAFGSKASFRQLWERDEDALGRVYPDKSRGRSFDHSEADYYLAAALAWWTGKDCDRIERLMRRSGLVRDKYDDDSYLRRTILRVCGRQTQVRVGRPAAATPRAGDDPAAGAPGAAAAPADIRVVGAADYSAVFGDATYIEDRYAAAVPDGTVLNPQQFRTSTRYGGRVFALGENKATRNAWEAFTESEYYVPRRAHGLCFRPEHPPGALLADAGRVLYNAYIPVQMPVSDESPEPFLAHMRKLFPVERDRSILLCWMAALVQHPGVKFQWAPLIQGTEGNGKTFIAAALTHCLGERFVHTPSAQDLANKFNGWLEGKLLIVVEEIRIHRDRVDVLDALKPIITNSRIEIQRKGADQVTGDNRANLLATTNFRDAIPKTNDDRRYAPFFCAQQTAADLARDGMDGDYFPRLWGWLRAGGGAAVNGYLRRMAIPDELNPATLCHRAPVTSSTAEAIETTRTPVEQAIIEAVEQGRSGFRGGWISSTAVSALLRDSRRLYLPLVHYRRTLEGLGYMMRGRTAAGVTPDGMRSVLYYKGTLEERPIAADAAAYEAAQQGTAAASQTPGGIAIPGGIVVPWKKEPAQR